MAKHRFSWGEAELVRPEGGGTSISATHSGRALALVFDDLLVAVDGRDAALSKSHIVTVRVPVKLDRDTPLVGYVEDVRGFARKTEGARVLSVCVLFEVLAPGLV